MSIHKSVEEVFRNIVMANHDNEVTAIAVVFINAQGEPELEIAVNDQTVYKIIAGLEILKLNIIRILLNDAAKPPKDRG